MNREAILKLQEFAEELKSMLGDDLVAVIIFGSVLKSKNFDDVDVLVIAKNPQKYMEKNKGY
ncbi:nucleotidyltransferase domain-containing protein [Pyrococcus kukulkanii]|uniref:Polymerase nucleotidyl transferase domain-containing protein n=1 Tax=Pyrococcus kukulkanii TaxID=1609559 RepID=A0ABV4T6B8_9EURY